MKAKMNALAVLAMLLLLPGCETPGTNVNTQGHVITQPEVAVQASPDQVRAAARKIMAEREYEFTQAGADTLLFDRGADLGTSARFGFMYGKDAYRRVRMTLTTVGGETRVTGKPCVVINRGTAFEREEADTSQGARNLIQQILEKIREQAQGVGSLGG